MYHLGPPPRTPHLDRQQAARQRAPKPLAVEDLLMALTKHPEHFVEGPFSAVMSREPSLPWPSLSGSPQTKPASLKARAAASYALPMLAWVLAATAAASAS